MLFCIFVIGVLYTLCFRVLVQFFGILEYISNVAMFSFYVIFSLVHYVTKCPLDLLIMLFICEIPTFFPKFPIYRYVQLLFMVICKILINADIFRWGYITIKWHVVHRKMKCLHHRDINKAMSIFYLPSIKVSLHFCYCIHYH